METEKKAPIVLVNSVSSIFVQKFHGILNRLGYKNIEKIGWDDLQCAKTEHGLKVFVIPFEHNSKLDRGIQKALERAKKMPVLGIIQKDKKPNIDLLTHCSEFLCWPCSENELALRIERLFDRFRISPNKAGDAKSFEGLVDLNMVGSSPHLCSCPQSNKKNRTL